MIPYEKFPNKEIVKNILRKNLSYQTIDIMMNSKKETTDWIVNNYILWCSSDMRKECGCIIDGEGHELYKTAIMAAITRLRAERNHRMYHSIDEKRNVIVSMIIKTCKSFLSK